MIQVLIVEDDPMVAMLNQQFIEQIDQVKIVGNVKNVEQAMTILKEQPVDLMLLDVYLPGMTGIEFLAEMRKEKIETSVILITAADDVLTVKKAINYGVVDYLIKPFSFERFKLAYERFIDLRKITGKEKVTNQSMLDKFFLSANEREQEEQLDLPKGLSRLTLRKVAKSIEQIKQPFSTEDLANQILISRISTKKYLLFLVEIGYLTEEIEYREIGRPVTLYQSNPSFTASIERYQ
ncbi:response regulator [Isobaculum melis]|uniref:Transcriptional regulatory protein n=1 Tax=Isobaculum melis TaxID=142588 RepID=A0A1H9RRM2_9LACT|nr:response regulator [Isobaculum melis]SER75611.1 two-component system, CitB family, response regulator MalR [Isobaculum melis]